PVKSKKTEHNSKAVLAGGGKKIIGGKAFSDAIVVQVIHQRVRTILLGKAEQVESSLAVDREILIRGYCAAWMISVFTVNGKVFGPFSVQANAILQSDGRKWLAIRKDPAEAIPRIAADRTVRVTRQTKEGSASLSAKSSG